MDYLIHIRKTGTAAEFATKVGVARSTFFEYMDYMRNELNIVILYDRSAKTKFCIYNHRTTKTNQKYPSVNL